MVDERQDAPARAAGESGSSDRQGNTVWLFVIIGILVVALVGTIIYAANETQDLESQLEETQSALTAAGIATDQASAEAQERISTLNEKKSQATEAANAAATEAGNLSAQVQALEGASAELQGQLDAALAEGASFAQSNAAYADALSQMAQCTSALYGVIDKLSNLQEVDTSSAASICASAERAAASLG